MSQSIGIRTEVLGTLTCLSPVHVGGWDTTVEASLAIARDGTGEPYLPSTSIAGALRAYLAGVERFRDRAELLDVLFGHVIPGTQDGSASWLRVDDAPLVGTDAAPRVRDGVGIDRRSASAAANFLYTRQVLPVGTRFALRLVADTATTAGLAYPGGPAALVGDAIEEMLAGLTLARVPIGAGRGRGLGRVVLGGVELRRADLSDPAGLVAWLTGAVPAMPASPAAGDRTRPPAGRLEITVGWRPVAPVLVRDSLPGAVVDTLPLTDIDVRDDTVRLLVPGSSIRGVLRAHAERIVRTLRRQDAPGDFGAALRDPPPGVDVLFGRAPAGSGGGPGWRGVLSVADCRSQGRVAAREWYGILATRPEGARVPGEEREVRAHRNTERDAARSVLHGQLDRIGDRIALGVSDHVAIDRWTGGAGEHRLFSVLHPDTTVAWEPIRIDVDVARLARYRRPDAPPVPLALPLLLLVLRDLRDGWLSLGYSGTRGYGQIEVTGVAFVGGGLDAPWSSLAGCTLDSILADPPAEVTAAMSAWAGTFQEEVA
jgi:CRISPR/Cas system CSM-associated protein Csm3 (group 7 of RAMP superfamily)